MIKRLPLLSELTHTQKDELIIEQDRRLREQGARLEALESKLRIFTDRLSKNSRNSSKPPSSDGYDKPHPRSRRSTNKKGKKRKPGGQPGHAGSTLKATSHPTQIDAHDPQTCERCSVELGSVERLGYEARQVYDLPPLALAVTEHRSYKKRCVQCGTVNQGKFPCGVTQATQYGPKIKSLMIYMNQYQLLPFKRTSEFFSDVFGQRVSVGTLVSATKTVYRCLAGAEEHIKAQLACGALLHADETGFRVNQSSHWLHVGSTKRLTYYAAHRKRGREAMEAIGLLPSFEGVLVHDHLKSYFHYGKHHSLCNAHHLRELTFVQERYQYRWAKRLESLLLEIKRAVDRHRSETGESLPAPQCQRYRRRYMNLLYRGKSECPRILKDPDTGKSQRKQSKARNLLERLRRFNQNTLAFMYDADVPFDNNQAERDIRMMKVQQKISGCFRTLEGIERFSRIRGYLSTAKKQGIGILTAIDAAIENQAILFNA